MEKSKEYTTFSFVVGDSDAQAGFQDVTISCVGCNCCADSTEHDQKVSISIFAAYGVKK